MYVTRPVMLTFDGFITASPSETCSLQGNVGINVRNGQILSEFEEEKH